MKVRRLYDIYTLHCSLVDKAANLRRFIFTKRKEEDMDVVESLKLIEKALNDLSSRIDKFEEGNAFTFDTTELKKKGARFSKETINSLRSLYNSLGLLLGEKDDGDGEEISKEEALNALNKGIQESIKAPEEKKKNTEEFAAVISKALTDALKTVE